ncbi:MAG TPA: hypothetical protein VK515_06775 [Rhizomicrobium sp.]|nr:hypothetical protein [Rhizomicrobium sp.]
MRPVLVVTLCLAASLHLAGAQPAPTKPAPALPLESVIVTATKPSEAAIKTFVETRAAPTPILGRMARWTSKICPKTVGLGDTYAKYVTQRIRDIASAAGVPVNGDSACRPNIEVVFTTTPQGLMDTVRAGAPLLLGYHHTLSQADELAKVTHPIQAWYTTTSQDINGNRNIDAGRCGPGGAAVSPELELPCVIVVHSNGSRAKDGLSSGFFNILIVAEPAKLSDYEVGSLADYITMLALSQPASLDSCQELPSVSNMLAPDCASTTRRITDGDLAYLHALYKLPDGNFLAVQRDYIRDEMEGTLVAGKGR